MKKSVLTKRKIPILPSCNSNQIKAVLNLLDSVTGVIKTSYDSQDNSILIEYDLLKIIFSNLEDILIEQEMCQSIGMKKRLLTTWFDYLDTTAQGNALAPPAPCCNKPPRSTK